MNKTLWIVIAIIVVAGIAWYAWGSSGSSYQAPAPSASSTSSPQAGTNAATVTYTTSGFSPATLSVKVGTTVTFVNQNGDEMWIASNPHPTHQGYDGTTKSQHCAAGYAGPAPFDECAAVMGGGSWSFTFTKVGTWGYHNHGNVGDGGTIVVTQ